jgi:hypothetical protein
VNASRHGGNSFTRATAAPLQCFLGNCSVRHERLRLCLFAHECYAAPSFAEQLADRFDPLALNLPISTLLRVNTMKHTLSLTSSLATCLALTVTGCMGPLPSDLAPSTASQVALNSVDRAAVLNASRAAALQPRLLGEYVGHYDHTTGRFTLELKQEDGPSGGRPLGGFVALNTGLLNLNDNGTGVAGPATFNGGQMCASGQTCAVVTADNPTTRDIQNVRVEINGLSAGTTLVGTDALGTGYPSTAGNAGGWNYGTLAASGGAGTAAWIFDSAGVDFTFTAKIWGAYTRTSYSVSAIQSVTIANNVATADAAWSDSAPAWRDACLTTGSQVIGGVSAFTRAFVTPPFPFTMYDTTIDTDSWASSVEVSTAGTFGLGGVLSGSNATLTGASVADYTFFAFWDNLQATNGQVCAALDATSAAPNRRWVITWKNMNISGTPNSRLSFSVVAQEGTDKVWYLYHRYSSTTTSCTATNPTRGSQATFGVRGSGSTQVTQRSHNAVLLGTHPTTCPGLGQYLLLTPATANP